MAHAQTGAVRQYQNKIAKNRQSLGLPPEYGAPVMYRRRSLWEKAQPVISAASMFIPGGQFNPTGKGIFNFSGLEV